MELKTSGHDDSESVTTQAEITAQPITALHGRATQVPVYRYASEMAKKIEERWQQRWKNDGTFNAPNPSGDLAPADGHVPDNKLFVQDMFPYPSGSGLHVGHPLGYIATDVFARFHRMRGANVLHTLGYDSFGLPAEQYAVQTGTHPRITTEANIKNMKRQLGRLGFGHDERRSVATTDISFYHWTQWIFLTIYNSWYDIEANEGKGKARPISELIAEYSSAVRTLPEQFQEEFGGKTWSELDLEEQGRVLDSSRLVYQSQSMVNWCPGLGTVLANEEVTADGRSERGNFPVFRKGLRQWMMRITTYADRLLDDLDALDWPEKVKSMQRNWIGRSQGALVRFDIARQSSNRADTESTGAEVFGQKSDESFEVFTTRPDTLFGATYVVLAPEHDLVNKLAGDQWPDLPNGQTIDSRWTGGAKSPQEAVASYRHKISAKSDLERQESRDKTGVFIGSYALNPVNGDLLPVFIADYVLTGYGTGAIMAVPAHDTRDFEFAQKFDLPIRQVIAGGSVDDHGDLTEAYVGDGTAINSANIWGLDINGLHVDAAKSRTIVWLDEHQQGKEKVQYKLRDWLFARQRYWGEPFPIVYDASGQPHALPKDMLPVILPEVKDYQPVSFDPDDADSLPSPPLAKATDWVNVDLDLGDGLKHYTRDTNVMPQWAGSSWYQLRYIDPTNEETFCAPENEKYWVGPRPQQFGRKDPGGVDLYVGGVEHAVLHLLYSRFWHKVLFDRGLVSSWEPYRKLFNQGYIEAYAFTDDRGMYVPASEVVERDQRFFWTPTGGQTAGIEQEVHREYGKMGKSLKNSVSPDEIIDELGADTLRVYEMSMGPLDQSRPWATKDVVGAHRFLQRVWRLVVNEDSGGLAIDPATVDESSVGMNPVGMHSTRTHTDGVPETTTEDLDSSTSQRDRPLDDKTNRILNRTIAGAMEEYGELRNNTAIAKLIEYTNYLTKHFPVGAPRSAVEPLVLLLAPAAPHVAEELWSRLGHSVSLAHGPFPRVVDKWLEAESMQYPVQINGKVRTRIDVPADASRDEVQEAVLSDSKVVELLEGKIPFKVIVIPGKMVSLVIKN